MKNILTLILPVVMAVLPEMSFAQDAAVTNALKAKYGSAQWRTECQGWYLVSYNRDGTNFYAFADKTGNVIASNAVKYKIHKGYIEMQVFDQLKKDEHDSWERDMRQYEQDQRAYLSKKKAYENQVAAYNTSVAAAKKDAQNQWNAARQQAYNRAVELAKQQNAQAQARAGSSSSIGAALLGGILGGVNMAVAGKAAADKVAYQPFEDRIMAERNLLSAPYEPYNPQPQKPVEPSDGFEWRTYPLLQPCPYTNLDYAAIAEPGGHSKALKNGQYWGIVNASLEEVIPCRYSSVTRCGDLYAVCMNGKYGLMNIEGKKFAEEKFSSIKNENGMFVVQSDGKYGLLSPKGAEIMPCQYEKIEQSNGYVMCCKGGLWGVYTKGYEELYPCQFQEEQFIETNGDLLLRTKMKGMWGLVDFNSGKSLLPNNFTKIESFKLDGTPAFRVFREGKQGLYYANGVLLLPCEFSSINAVTVGNERMLEVKKGNYVGLYDMEGAQIISPDKYDSYQYQGDYYIVGSGQKKGVCSLFGEELVAPEYSSIEYTSSLHGFFVKKDGMCGLVDFKGNQAFPMKSVSRLEYDPAIPNVILVKNGYKENGAIDADGNEVVSPKFKSDKISQKVASYEKKNNIRQLHEQKNLSRGKLHDDYLTKVSVEKNRRKTFSFYARNYVERIVNEWQRRGEFEKMADWQNRVNESTRQQKVYALTKDAQDNYLRVNATHLPADAPSIVGKYDPDNETYQVRTSYSSKPIFIHVPTYDAEEFKTSFSSLKRDADFMVKDDGIALSEYAFTMPGGNTYRYKPQDNYSYSVAPVDYNFEKIDLGNLAGNFSMSSLKFGTSDVDTGIPTTDMVRKNTFAVIIANENYTKEKNVEFAYNDGMAFKDYCVKAMGIPATNVHFKPNAGLNDMRFEFNWVKKVAEDYKGDASFIIYYAGHGVPDDASKEAYILPVDGNGDDLESAYRLSGLYKMLGEIPSREVLVFMDACFSGSQRSGETLASARGVAIRPEITDPTGNLVVFSAVSDKETAYPYKDKVHGLFTYYLLKKIQSTSGNLDLGTLSDYVTDEVSRKSIVVNSKSQHPTVKAAPALVEKWRSLQIK